MKFEDFVREKEDEAIGQEQEENKSKIIGIFTTEEPVTVETILAKAEEFEMEKTELENEIYKILYDMLNVEETPEEEVPVEEIKPEI